MIYRSALSALMIVMLLTAIVPVQAGDTPNGPRTSNSSVSTYIVVFKDAPQAIAMTQRASDLTASNLIASYGGQVKYRYKVLNGMAVTVPDNMAGQLESLPNVKYVEKDQQAHILLADSIPQIGADQVWAEGYSGNGVLVAVIDTGVDASHPDLNGSKVVAWADFVNGLNSTPYDDNGHGTHVSSIIAGTGNASGGMYRGVAPNASLMVAKALDKNGTGYYSNIISAIDWAVSNHAQIMSMSLGGSHSESLNYAVDKAISAGVVVVVAAGNTGPSSQTIICPGDDPNVITVGAVDKHDVIASWSSRGPTQSGGYLKPDVTNVGVNVVAARASGTSDGTPINQYYTSMSGTSMATPMTSGVIALMLEKDSNLSPSQVKSILTMTAKPLGGSVPNYNYGYGRVQAKYAVDNVTYGSTYLSDTIPDTMWPGQASLVNVTMKNTGTYMWSKANNTSLRGLFDASRFGDTSFSLPAGVTVQPGDQYTWSFPLTAPTALGSYQPTYEIYSGLSPFGSTLNKSILVKAAEPGTLQFNSSAYGASKSAGNVTIKVDRMSGWDTTVMVNYSASGGNATAGSEYLPASGTLPFIQGQTYAVFNVTMLNDGVYHGDKSVNLTLSGTTGGATLGLSSAILTIKESNPRPVLQFDASNYILLRNQSNYTIAVLRSNNPHGPVSVNYTIGGGNATPGTDYIAANGTLSFSDMEISKSFNVTVPDDHVTGPDKSVNISLSCPTNGSVLGAPASATLLIKDVPLVNFTYNLNSGWNLISLPIVPQDPNITNMLPADVRNHIFVFWMYSGNGTWKFWTPLPGYTSTLSDVDVQHGYLVWCDSQVSFNVTGTLPVSDQISLKSGDYNIVGYPRLDSMSPAARYNDTLVVWGYKNGTWSYYTTLPGYTSTLASLEPGYGYEVYK